MIKKILLYLSSVLLGFITVSTFPFYAQIAKIIFNYSQNTVGEVLYSAPGLFYVLIIFFAFLYVLLFWWKGVTLKRVLLTLLAFPVITFVWLFFWFIVSLTVVRWHGPIGRPYSNWIGIPGTLLLPTFFLVSLKYIWWKKASPTRPK